MADPLPAIPRRPAVRPTGLLAVLAGYVLLAVAYGVGTPVFEQPDETTHFFMAQHIAQTARLPVQPVTEDEARGPWEQQGSQPPLYYFLAAPLLRLAGSDLAADDLWYNDQNTMGMPALVGNENRFVHDPAVEGWPWRAHVLAVHLARLLSTLMGLVTVLCAWAIAGHVFPTRPLLALAAAALVAFNPQFLAVHAALSNDPAVILLSTAALALTLRVASGHDDWPTVLALALAAGLAPLAKLSGLAVLGFVVLTLAVLAWRRRDWRWLARTAGPVLVVALVASGWWYWRNLALYGDVTGLNGMHPGGTKRDESLSGWLERLPGELKGVWYSTWGLFGWFTLLLPGWVYAAISALTVAALVGLAVAGRRRADWLRWSVLGWLALWGGIVFVSLLRWMAFTKGGQGRLLFPAVALFGAALVAGWRALAPARVGDRALVLCVGGTMTALALYSLFAVIRPAYALAARIPESAIPADAQRLDDVVFDGKLQLVAIQHPDRVVEGGQLPVTLYWKVLAPIERDGLVGLRVDQPVAEGARSGPALLAYPGAGTTPPRWMAPSPDVYVDRRIVDRGLDLATPVQAGADGPGGQAARQPVLAQLSVHLFDGTSHERWPLPGTAERTERGLDFVLDPATRPGLPPEVSNEDLYARFENGLLLYHVAPEGWLVWRATRPVTEDLTVFQHLVDGYGTTIAQQDVPPSTAARYPTSRWRSGDVIVTDRPSVSPADGARAVAWGVGLYRADGTRVAAYYPRAGTRMRDDTVAISLRGSP